MASYTIENGRKILVLDDTSKVDVVAPLNLEDGQWVRLIPAQFAKLTEVADNTADVAALLAAATARLLAASDLLQTYNYLDPGTANQRVSTVVYSSSSLSLTMTETYAYAGSPGSYYLTTITRALS